MFIAAVEGPSSSRYIVYVVVDNAEREREFNKTEYLQKYKSSRVYPSDLGSIESFISHLPSAGEEMPWPEPKGGAFSFQKHDFIRLIDFSFRMSVRS
jgi:hypothetical protein